MEKLHTILVIDDEPDVVQSVRDLLRLEYHVLGATRAQDGIGIDPNALTHIFEPFFTRFDVSNHSSASFDYDRCGLGLGLSVAKAFVEMHGGRVGVDSAPGRGPTFTVALPHRPET